MKVTGKISVKAPREQVFDKVQDARFFASCIDGVRDLEEIDETHYTAVMETKVAYIKFKFDIELEIERKEAPSLIEARAVGTPAGVVGRMTSAATTTLTEDGDETIIDYVVDANLTGKLGSIGQPVLMSKAREMEREFTKRLRAAFAEGEGESAPEAVSAPATPAAEQSNVATGSDAQPGLFARIWSFLVGLFGGSGGSAGDAQRGQR